MPRRKFVSLAEYMPELLSEWNYEKNEGIAPDTISYGSATKVWWICSEGHEWEATSNDRIRGRGCPICANERRMITKRINMLKNRGSLMENCPDLAAQWHPTKNGSLTASDVTSGTDLKVWWQCALGHEWQAAINSRKSGTGCPICSGFQLLEGYNDLATVNPSLAAQWNYQRNGELKPTQVKVHDRILVWWICSKGHEWEARITDRESGDYCPICAGRKILLGFNDLPTTMPHLVKEWHPTKNGTLTPYDVTAGSNKKVHWICEKGHEWVAPVTSRALGFTGCPVCFGERKTSFPEQTIFYYLRQLTTAYNRYITDNKAEIDIYLPEYKIGIEYDGAMFHSGEKARQREARKQKKLDSLGIRLIRIRECEGGTTDNTIYSRARASSDELANTIYKLLDLISSLTGETFTVDIDIDRDRPKIFEQYILSEKENSLRAKNPELAEEWHPTKNGSLQPEHVTIYSNRKAWWLCKNGHEWDAVIGSRRGGVGCPYCCGKKAVEGVNDLATLHSDLAAEWHPTKNGDLLPSQFTEFSNKKIWWKCQLGHEYECVIGDRSNGGGCPICAGKRVLRGFNDLFTTQPLMAAEWHPTKNGTLTPADVTQGSDKRVWWECKFGHEWIAPISSRSAGTGCPYCAGQLVIPGTNDLATLNPELASEWHPTKNGEMLPETTMPGSNKRVWWLCKNGHEWEAVISSRNSGVGCPYCSFKSVLVGYNDLATLNPKLASEWHPTKNGDLSPYDVVPGSNKKAWWLGKCGHEWEALISSRNAGRNCPYCSNEKLLVGFNDLLTLNPKLASEWHPTKNGDLTPQDFIPGSNKKAWWICSAGHEWEAVIGSRQKGAGCMACYRERRKKKPQ